MSKNGDFIESGLKQTNSTLVTLLQSENIPESADRPDNKRAFLELFLKLLHDTNQAMQQDILEKAVTLCDTLKQGKQYKSMIQDYAKHHSAYYHE